MVSAFLNCPFVTGFGNIAEPGLLIQLTYKSGLTVLADLILHTYIPAILPKSFRPRAA